MLGGFARWIGFLTMAVGAVAVLVLTVGFFWFAINISTDDPQVERKADGIVVLTGAASRIPDAIELLAAERGKRLFTAEDARLAAIARETMVQAWEAVEQHLLRTIGSSAVKNGQRFERLFRDLATMAAHRNTMLREEFWRQLGAIDLGVSYPSPGGTWPPSPTTTPQDRA